VTRTYILLVRRDLGARSLNDLQNRDIIVLTSGVGWIGRLWMDVTTLRHGHTASEHFYGKITRAESGSRAVLPVFFGQSDACVVTKRSFETLA
jgi:hypothetical protein